MASKIETPPKDTRLSLSKGTHFPAKPTWYRAKTIRNNGKTILATFFLIFLVAFQLIVIFVHFSKLKPPALRLSSLILSKLVIADAKLATSWKANFTIWNPSFVYEMSFDRIETFAFYQENELIATSLQEPFRLGSREEKHTIAEIETNGREENQPIVEYPMVKKIIENKKIGEVRFSVRATSWGTYRAIYWKWSREIVMNSYCMDFNVEILDVELGSGRLVDLKPVECFVVLMPYDN